MHFSQKAKNNKKKFKTFIPYDLNTLYREFFCRDKTGEKNIIPISGTYWAKTSVLMQKSQKIL